MNIVQYARRCALAVGGLAIGFVAAFGLPATVAAQEDPLIVNMAQAPATLDPAWGCGIVEVGFVQKFLHSANPVRLETRTGRNNRD